MGKQVLGLQLQHERSGSHSISRPSPASQSLFSLMNPQNVLSSGALGIPAASDVCLPPTAWI